MTSIWITVAATGVATIIMKSFGPLTVGGRDMPESFHRAIALLAPAVLAALVVTLTFADGRSLVLDARALGMAAAVVAVALRAPVLVVVASAAAVTALARAL